jgi:hypothetical protein
MNYFWIDLIQNTNINKIAIINALIIFLIGFIVSIWVKNIGLTFLKKIRFDNTLDQTGANEFLVKNNIDIIKLIGYLIEIFFIIVTIMLSFEALQLHTLSNMTSKIIFYYPNIFISIIIFIIAIYAIDISQRTFIGTKNLKEITYSRIVVKIIEWSIRILAVLAILYQLQIIPQLIAGLFIGFVAAISLAVGISLGLAAKEPMAKAFKKITEMLKFF